MSFRDWFLTVIIFLPFFSQAQNASPKVQHLWSDLAKKTAEEMNSYPNLKILIQESVPDESERAEVLNLFSEKELNYKNEFFSKGDSIGFSVGKVNLILTIMNPLKGLYRIGDYEFRIDVSKSKKDQLAQLKKVVRYKFPEFKKISWFEIFLSRAQAVSATFELEERLFLYQKNAKDDVKFEKIVDYLSIDINAINETVRKIDCKQIASGSGSKGLFSKLLNITAYRANSSSSAVKTDLSEYAMSLGNDLFCQSKTPYAFRLECNGKQVGKITYISNGLVGRITPDKDFEKNVDHIFSKNTHEDLRNCCKSDVCPGQINAFSPLPSETIEKVNEFDIAK